MFSKSIENPGESQIIGAFGATTQPLRYVFAVESRMTGYEESPEGFSTASEDRGLIDESRK